MSQIEVCIVVLTETMLGDGQFVTTQKISATNKTLHGRLFHRPRVGECVRADSRSYRVKDIEIEAVPWSSERDVPAPLMTLYAVEDNS